MRRSTVLSNVEEAAIVAFRVSTRLALDDVVGALRPSIPALTGDSARRALQHQGVSWLPRATRPNPLFIAELRTAREKAHLFIAVTVPRG